MRNERRNMQIVFQDPMGSLNPRMRIGAILGEALLTHKIVPKSQLAAEINRLLALVGMQAEAADRFPHEFSGGQRQRIGIARALSVRPQIIVADEPISALDVSIRAQIINLLRAVQQESGVAILFIAHDLGAVRQISDRIAVMYLGKIVETGDADSIYESPSHPYTRALLGAIPSVEVSEHNDVDEEKLTDEPPSALNLPTGCRFRTRCPIAQARCADDEPVLRPIGGNGEHLAACHFA
jgi:oligopeptide/dipeptide ABC transporter ATP-binding protein